MKPLFSLGAFVPCRAQQVCASASSLVLAPDAAEVTRSAALQAAHDARQQLEAAQVGDGGG